MPVLARNVVATTQPLAVQAGLHMLRQGGNAVDAAIGTAIAMTVLEPINNAVGSDAFSLIWHEGKVYGINASGRAPRAMTAKRFEGKKEVTKRGWDPVTVPGAVSAWVALSKRFGKLPFEKLFEPAIGYAEEGYLVAPRTAAGWVTSFKVFKDFPDWNKTWAPKGRAPEAGERFVNPDLGKTLRRIAETKGAALYGGDLAEKIAAHAKATGGLMTVEDLASHQPDWVEPLHLDYRGLRLYEIPPNGQGMTTLLALGMLRERNLGSLDVDCADVLHQQIEAMKLAFADAKRYIADPRAMDVKPQQLLGAAYLKERAKLIDPMRASDPGFGMPPRGGTILLCAADAAGTMVSYIQSNYEGFGSGIVIPGTSISMQNRGACFVLDEGHPNQIAGGKRPYHTIIPAMVTRPDEFGMARDIGPGVQGGGNVGEQPVMAYGVMGGFMQPQGHLQVMCRLADFRQNPQAALDAPRWQVKRDVNLVKGLKVSIEPGFREETYDDLRRRGHDLEMAKTRNNTFGAGEAIYKLADGYAGASDPRGDGQAAGF
jgi:gamma-glutamyltranspeptidase/glutathione hydrolase